MASTIIQPVANAIKEVIDGIPLTPPFKSYVWEPQDVDSYPAATIAPPTIRRVSIENPESQLGSDDWIFEFTIFLCFDVGEVIFSQTQAVEYAEAFIDAIDDNQDLKKQALEAKVVSIEYKGLSKFSERSTRECLAYECEIDVLKLVAN